MLEAIRVVDPDIRFYQASSSRDVRQGRRGAPDRADAALPPLALRRGQGLRPLDHGELPGELRHPRQLGHPLQPRLPPAGPRVRRAQDQPRRGPHRSWPRHASCGSATSTPSGTGASPATTSRPCGGCCSSTSPATTSSPRARPTRCGSCASWPSATSAWTGPSTSVQDERFYRPAEVDLLIGDPAKARKAIGWEVRTPFAELVRHDGRRRSRAAGPSSCGPRAGRLSDLRARRRRRCRQVPGRPATGRAAGGHHGGRERGGRLRHARAQHLARPRHRHLHAGRRGEPRDRLGAAGRDVGGDGRAGAAGRRDVVPPGRPGPRHPPVPHRPPGRRVPPCTW